MQGKLAIFARVERFAQLIAKHDGGTLLVNSTLAIFSRPEDKEDFELAGQQRAALTQGIEALGTIAPFLAPATFAPAIPVVLASLETLQNRACLVCIEQLAHDESNIASIFKINDRDVAFSVEDSKWKIQIDPATGREYYVNEETRESMWIKPVELGVAERMGKIGDLDTIGTILQMLREGGDDPETSIPACVSSQPIFNGFVCSRCCFCSPSPSSALLQVRNSRHTLADACRSASYSRQRRRRAHQRLALVQHGQSPTSRSLHRGAADARSHRCAGPRYVQRADRRRQN